MYERHEKGTGRPLSAPEGLIHTGCLRSREGLSHAIVDSPDVMCARCGKPLPYTVPGSPAQVAANPDRFHLRPVPQAAR